MAQLSFLNQFFGSVASSVISGAGSAASYIGNVTGATAAVQSAYNSIVDTRGYQQMPFSSNFQFPKSRDAIVSKGNHLMIIYVLPRPGASGALGATRRDRNTFRSNDPPTNSIALYMPNTIAFSQNNLYEDVSMAELGGKMLKPIGGKIGAMAGAAAQILNRPINPYLEVLFKATSLRQFQFDFLFAPTTEEDANEVQRIIRNLREAVAPSVTGLTGSVVFTPPCKFNFEFFRNNGAGGMVKNDRIPSIGTCVIDSLDVDYAPTGVYSTFSTGHPVATRLQLRVKEDNTLTDIFVRQGF